jgi:uncharacterized protein (DUF302 family)
MKKLLILILLIDVSCNSKNNPDKVITSTETPQPNWITKASPYDAAVTMNNLKAAVESLGFTIVAHIDHSTAAAKNDLTLTPTQVLIFGNPKVGTLLMQADPRVGLDLPLKIVVWEAEGETFIGYRDPAYLLTDYSLENQQSIVAKMQGALAKVTDLAVQK